MLDEFKWMDLEASFRYILENNHRLWDADFYVFGVYEGASLELILRLSKQYKVNYRRIHAIDSFEGLPTNQNSFEKFKEGSYKSGKTWQELNTKFAQFNINIIKSWYKDLHSSQIGYYNMKPAKLIHIDCDLYESTVDALTFMFDNKLVEKGTLITFNEFIVGEVEKSGEAEAFWYITEKYNVQAEEVWKWRYFDKDTGDSIIQSVWEIINVG